jgi:hypothetical protein
MKSLFDLDETSKTEVEWSNVLDHWMVDTGIKDPKDDNFNTPPQIVNLAIWLEERYTRPHKK